MLSTSYQNINKSLCYSPVVLALTFGAVGCGIFGDPTTTTGSSDSDGDPDHYWLHCLGEDLPAICVPDADEAYCIQGYSKEAL